MSPDQLRERIAHLRQWNAGGRRAPHKPLLMLWALARFAEGTEQFPFNAVEAPLVGLLDDFGPPSGIHRPFSFWRLASDGLWEIDGADAVRRTASGDMRLTDARDQNPVARFPAPIARLLRRDPRLIAEIASNLLAAQFPDTVHDDVLAAVGLYLDVLGAAPGPRVRHRDPAFRRAVITAYGYRCAVCGFETRIGNTLVGVDAAHVRWHQAGGPDVDDVTNGVALCALHHRLFDRGAFTLSPRYGAMVVEVAEEAHGGAGFKSWLLDFHGVAISEPVRSDYRVAEPSLAWHRAQVFRGRARDPLGKTAG